METIARRMVSKQARATDERLGNIEQMLANLSTQIGGSDVASTTGSTRSYASRRSRSTVVSERTDNGPAPRYERGTIGNEGPDMAGPSTTVTEMTVGSPSGVSLTPRAVLDRYIAGLGQNLPSTIPEASDKDGKEAIADEEEEVEHDLELEGHIVIKVIKDNRLVHAPSRDQSFTPVTLLPQEPGERA